jgi:hypothetical protein
MFNQGNIVSFSFPFVNVSVLKKRPALVISNKKVNQTGDYLPVEITPEVKNGGFSVMPSQEDYSSGTLPLKSYNILLNESLIFKRYPGLPVLLGQNRPIKLLI